MTRRPAGPLVAVLVALIAAAALAPAAGAALTKQERALQNRLERLVATDGGPPGASVLLQVGKRQKFLRAGVANLATGAPFKRTDRMRIASVSKAFSGAVALSLVADGKLSLDDTIGELRPDLPVDWWPVTLRQLLSHTGGVPSFTKDQDFLEYFGANPRAEISKLGLIRFIEDDDLDFPPGSAYEYSNTDNIIIALIAEKVTGRSYGRLLRGFVTRPLGLGDTFLPVDWKVPKPRIEGYETLPEPENLTTCCSMAFVSSSGGIVSTPEELTRFTRAYVGGKLFGGAARREQFSFRAGGSEPPGPGEMSTGLAMFRYKTRCGSVFGHSGNFPGYTQFTVATRNGRRGLTFSVNRQLDPNAPGILAPQAFKVLRKDFGAAVCTLRGR
jgi:D-alanyl-D-alanine carboxypeptidase